MVFDGTWQVSIATPIGKQSVVLEISTENGLIRGTARQGAEIVDFVEPVVEGKRFTWSQTITKPMSMRLKFDVTVEENRMNGTAKAGMFPASTLTGERVV